MPHQNNVTILFVDDDAGVLQGFARVATAMGFNVISASMVQEAMANLSKADILIVDLKLSGEMTGEIILDAWLGRRPGPCCVLSGHIDRSKEFDLIIRGADNVIRKPAPIAALQAILNRYSRHVNTARLQKRLLHEIKNLEDRIDSLEQTVLRTGKESLKNRKRFNLALVALAISLATVLGLDMTGALDIIGKLIGFL